MTTIEALYSSPLGTLRLGLVEDGLCSIQIGGPPMDRRHGTATAIERAVCEQLDAYCAGRLRRFDLPLRPNGSAFQTRVWEALQMIPFGTTTSYGALAEALGSPSAARAVGLANARNPLMIVVPCHRVIGRDGSLVGYAGGLDAKRWLLAHEGAKTALGLGRRAILPGPCASQHS